MKKDSYSLVLLNDFISSTLFSTMIKNSNVTATGTHHLLSSQQLLTVQHSVTEQVHRVEKLGDVLSLSGV